MAAGSSKSQWNHTANLMALVANIARKPNSRTMTASDFNPHSQKSESNIIHITKENIGILRNAFGKGIRS